VALALGAFTEIDQGDVRFSDNAKRLRGGHCPAAARNLFLMEADLHIGRDSNIHHLRVSELQVVHQLNIFIDRFYLEPRVEGLLLADGGDGVALIVVCRIDQGRLRQL
jgi:hypothetical protein